MPDYQQGKIYCLRSHKTDDIYIGSTTRELAVRKSGHKADYKRYLKGKFCYVSSFELCQYDDVYIELIEDYPCENKAQLLKREGYWMREMECVNKCIAGRSKNEWRDNNKEFISEKGKIYYEVNKEQISERHRKYRDVNKETISERNRKHYNKNKETINERSRKHYETVGKQKVNCGCGSVVNRSILTRHKRTKKHIAWA